MQTPGSSQSAATAHSLVSSLEQTLGQLRGSGISAEVEGHGSMYPYSSLGLRVLISSVDLCVQSFFARAARALRIIARREVVE